MQRVRAAGVERKACLTALRTLCRAALRCAAQVDRSARWGDLEEEEEESSEEEEEGEEVGAGLLF